MESLKYNIVTLGNGNKYFVYDEYMDDDKTFELILNVEEENDIDVVEKVEKGSKIILKEIEDADIKNNLIKYFKENN